MHRAKTLAFAILVLAAATLATSFVYHAYAGGRPKLDICHIPPGNPANFHTISVGEPAVPSHLAHGDLEGACPDCLEISHEDRTYLICPGAKTQPESADFCENVGMELATISDDDENEWIIASALDAFGWTSFQDSSYWIANLRSTTPFARWANGEPNGDGNCIHILRYFNNPDPLNSWNDAGCQVWRWGWVCESSEE